MPDTPIYSKRRPAETFEAEPLSTDGPAYAELRCRSNFSFLEGASHPDELVNRAAELGYRALAITDRNSLAGVVRAHVAAKAAGLKLLIGAELTFRDAPTIIVWPTNRAAYGRLCQLLTRDALDGVLALLHELLLRRNDKTLQADPKVTVFVPASTKGKKNGDNVYVYQLTDYIGPKRPYGQGRTLDVRLGAVGEAFRHGDRIVVQSVNEESQVPSRLVEAGFTHEEAAVMDKTRRVWLAAPIGRPVVAVIYVTAAKKDFFGELEDLKSFANKVLNIATSSVADYVEKKG